MPTISPSYLYYGNSTFQGYIVIRHYSSIYCIYVSPHRIYIKFLHFPFLSRASHPSRSQHVLLVKLGLPPPCFILRFYSSHSLILSLIISSSSLHPFLRSPASLSSSSFYSLPLLLLFLLLRLLTTSPPPLSFLDFQHSLSSYHYCYSSLFIFLCSSSCSSWPTSLFNPLLLALPLLLIHSSSSLPLPRPATPYLSQPQ